MLSIISFILPRVLLFSFSLPFLCCSIKSKLSRMIPVYRLSLFSLVFFLTLFLTWIVFWLNPFTVFLSVSFFFFIIIPNFFLACICVCLLFIALIFFPSGTPTYPLSQFILCRCVRVFSLWTQTLSHFSSSFFPSCFEVFILVYPFFVHPFTVFLCFRLYSKLLLIPDRLSCFLLLIQFPLAFCFNSSFSLCFAFYLILISFKIFL